MFVGLRWGQGGENFPDWMRLGETQSEFARSPDAAARTSSILVESQTVLAGARLLADGGDIANLAYPLPGTEGSNPSLSAKILSLEVLGSNHRNRPHRRLHSHIQQHRREAPSRDLRARCGPFLCSQRGGPIPGAQRVRIEHRVRPGRAASICAAPAWLTPHTSAGRGRGARRYE